MSPRAHEKWRGRIEADGGWATHAERRKAIEELRPLQTHNCHQVEAERAGESLPAVGNGKVWKCGSVEVWKCGSLNLLRGRLGDGSRRSRGSSWVGGEEKSDKLGTKGTKELKIQGTERGAAEEGEGGKREEKEEG
jgi:hypothetical protein